MSYHFSPIGNGVAFVDSNGNPLSGAKLFTYTAGSTTKDTVFQTNAGTAHANPMILDANGRPPAAVWLRAGRSYKFVLAPSNDTDPPTAAIYTWDNVSGINDTTVSVDQWVTGPTPTFVDADTFTLVGDQSSTFHVNRRLKLTVSAGTRYGRVSAVAYTTLTTVDVVLDSGTLDSGLSAVSYALLSATNRSYPGNVATTDTAQTFSAANVFSANNNFSVDQTINGLKIGRGAGSIASNTCLGGTALASNTTGADNTGVGLGALTANTTGANNTAFGSGSLDVNTTAIDNTAVGHNALGASVTGNANVAVGKNAMLLSNGGEHNVAVGVSSLDANTTGSGNVAIGVDALGANTTASNNTAVGRNALLANTTGTSNTGVGFNALSANTTAIENTAVGTSALGSNTTGTTNTAVGHNALIANTTGTGNTACGKSALAACTTPNSNTAVGLSALSGVTTGAQNTAIGDSSGSNVTTGSNCQLFGFSASASSATATNEVTLGNASIATLRCAVTTITAISDRRDKRDIRDIGVGLSFVNQLKPVKFKWQMRDGTEKPDTFEPGFIAQDFKQLQEKENAEWLGLVYESNPEKLEATPGKLLPVLVKAIQELSAQNEKLMVRLAALESHTNV